MREWLQLILLIANAVWILALIGLSIFLAWGDRK